MKFQLFRKRRYLSDKELERIERETDRSVEESIELREEAREIAELSRRYTQEIKSHNLANEYADLIADVIYQRRAE